MKILLTGFSPFLDNDSNPSELICQALQQFSGDVVTKTLPVAFEAAFTELKKHVEMLRPKIVIMLGLASSQRSVHIEKVALNWRESRYPDVTGLTPLPGPIVAGAELAIMSNFPVNELETFLLGCGHDIKMSFSAGTYVCNSVYYNMLIHFPEIKSLFIHVPPVEEMGLHQQIEIIKLALMHGLRSD